ncbi:MAG: hypothetical protein JRJ62_15205 [Deltaproteobacteria bacterium]|nr:hypothetical protein [Deltaproteobacteria bacterium]
MSKLPLIDTTTKVEKSISEIVGYLEKLGFDQMIQGSSKEKGRFIAAQKDGIAFHWTVNPVKVMQAIIEDKGEKIKVQAERVAWRVMKHKIKADCDAILYEAAEIADVFAGYLVMNTKGGQTTTFGKYLAQAQADGKLTAPDIMAPLMIEDNTK